MALDNKNKPLDNKKAKVDNKNKPLDNDYWRNITAIKKRQTEKGLRNYGQRLEDNTELSVTETLTYLEEELVDALMYIEHVKNKLRAKRPYFTFDSYYNGEPVLDAWQCPACGEEYEIEIRHNYCPECGQKIDWEEDTDE